jgi:oxygen-dependent protoporphyrinogen oxidase
MATLTQAVALKLGGNVRWGTPVVAVQQCNASEGHGFQVTGEAASGAANEKMGLDAVVVATPAYVAAHMLKNSFAHLAQQLAGIAYAGVAVVNAGYDARQIGSPLDGFGVLIPRSEKCRTLGTVWNSALFPGRAPENHFTITSFLGGATDPEILAQSEEEVAAIAQQDTAKILGISGPPTASAVWKYPKALPQYNLGHGHVVEAIRDGERQAPGLFFAGNYLEGPAIGKCIEQGFKTAETVKTHLDAGR